MKRIIFLLATMLALFAINAHADKILYSENYESGTTVPATWTVNGGTASIAGDTEGHYLSFALGSNNGRSAHCLWGESIFDAVKDGLTEYTVHYEFQMQAFGNNQYNGEMALFTGESCVKTNGNTGGNWDPYCKVTSNCLWDINQAETAIKAMETKDPSLWYLMGDDTNTLNLVVGSWYEVNATVNVATREVSWTLADFDETLSKSGSFTLAEDANIYASGLYLMDARYQSVTNVDNIQVTIPGEFANDPNAIEVNINEAQTEATFTTKPYNTLVSYELVRDMSISMTAEVAERIRIALNDQEQYVPVEEGGMDVTVTDGIEETTLTEETNYTKQLQKKGEGDDNWTDVTALSVGTFRYVITGTGNYDGTCTSNEFKLYEGYEVEIEAGGFATYYKDEPLTIDESTPGAKLYTVSEVSDKAAVLSSKITVAPAETPLLVYNTTEEKKTFLLVPTDETADEGIEPADEFKGTLVAMNMGASTDNMNYYVCDGTQFVWVRSAGTIAANRCWLQIGTAEPDYARAIVFGETTSVNEELRMKNEESGDYYDLQGRKVIKPTRKGVFIQKGKKVVVK